MPGATDADYRNSGFSGGHAVPARDMAFNDEARDDTFLRSAAVPQDPLMNSSIWRRMENRVRSSPKARAQ